MNYFNTREYISILEICNSLLHTKCQKQQYSQTSQAKLITKLNYEYTFTIDGINM